MSARFEFVMTGVKPLLLHADNVEWGDTLKSWQTDPANRDISKAGDDRSPAWTWMGYLPGDEVASVPCSYIAAALRDAGRTFKIGKGNKTYKEAASSLVWFEPPAEFGGEFFPILIDGKMVPSAAIRSRLLDCLDFTEHLATAKRHGFRLDVRRARVGQSKHVRVRPRFEPGWTVRGTLELADPDILPPSVLAQLFDIAGRRGIGDYRPSSKAPGPFGMFEASLTPVK